MPPHIIHVHVFCRQGVSKQRRRWCRPVRTIHSTWHRLSSTSARGLYFLRRVAALPRQRCLVPVRPSCRGGSLVAWCGWVAMDDRRSNDGGRQRQALLLTRHWPDPIHFRGRFARCRVDQIVNRDRESTPQECLAISKDCLIVAMNFCVDCRRCVNMTLNDDVSE